MAARPRVLRGGGIGGESPSDERFAIANRPADVRAEAVASADREHAWLRTRTREVLEGTSREDYSDDQVDEVVQDLLAVRTRARDNVVAAVEAGRLLRRIQERVGPQGYKGLLKAGLAYVPENTASTYRKLAEVVDGGLVPLERMPAAIRPAYDLARLEPPVLELVAERVRLGPATTAREIKEALGQVQAETAPQPIDADRLRTRIRELEKQRDAALQKARQLEEQIAALRTQLELQNPKRRMRGRAAA
jgi:hypothetical protein